MRKIWLDDMRPAPEGYEWVKDYWEAVAAWETGGTPDIASLDHDLWGMTEYDPKVYEYTGYDFVKWLCGDNPGEEDSGRWPYYSVAIHTDREDGRANMANLIEKYGPYEYREPYENSYPSSWGGNIFVYGYIYFKEDPYASKGKGSESGQEISETGSPSQESTYST